MLLCACVRVIARCRRALFGASAVRACGTTPRAPVRGVVWCLGAAYPVRANPGRVPCPPVTVVLKPDVLSTPQLVGVCVGVCRVSRPRARAAHQRRSAQRGVRSLRAPVDDSVVLHVHRVRVVTASARGHDRCPRVVWLELPIACSHTGFANHRAPCGHASRRVTHGRRRAMVV